MRGVGKFKGPLQVREDKASLILTVDGMGRLKALLPFFQLNSHFTHPVKLEVSHDSHHFTEKN